MAEPWEWWVWSDPRWRQRVRDDPEATLREALRRAVDLRDTLASQGSNETRRAVLLVDVLNHLTALHGYEFDLWQPPQRPIDPRQNCCQARPSGILCIVDRDRADEAWTRFRRSAINHPRTWQLLAGGVAGVALFAWEAFAASASKRVGYGAMAAFDGLVLVLLVRLRAFVRTHERPPEWWYREGWVDRWRARRNHKQVSHLERRHEAPELPLGRNRSRHPALVHVPGGIGDAVVVLVLVTGLQGTGKSTIAERCADMLGAPVFAWDWVMAALTPFERVQETLRALDRPTHRAVGWAVMWQLSRAQLQRGKSVVLDGLVRANEVTQTRDLAREHGVECLVVLTTCDDLDLQQSRVEGRTRGIPGWYELTWDHVAETRRSWKPPADVDVVLDCSHSIEDNVAVLQRVIQYRQRC